VLHVVRIHDRLCPLLGSSSPDRIPFRQGVCRAAAEIFSLGDPPELVPGEDIKVYQTPFGVPVEGQSAYDIVIEVEVLWSPDLDATMRERSIRLRTAVRDLAKQFGYDLKVAVWVRVFRSEWISDEVPEP
jgi:hypothetical protein